MEYIDKLKDNFDEMVVYKDLKTTFLFRVKFACLYERLALKEI